MLPNYSQSSNIKKTDCNFINNMYSICLIEIKFINLHTVKVPQMWSASWS